MKSLFEVDLSVLICYEMAPFVSLFKDNDHSLATLWWMTVDESKCRGTPTRWKYRRKKRKPKPTNPRRRGEGIFR
jgi:hypothetical protein